MTASGKLCVVAINVEADDRLRALLGADLAAQAVQHGLERAGQGIVRGGGSLRSQHAPLLLAGFDDCDRAVLAVSAILDTMRAAALPAGVRQPLRIGLHHGECTESDGELSGDGVELARQLAGAAQAEQALASSTVVSLLTAAARPLAGAQAFNSAASDRMEGPVFEVGTRLAGLTTAVLPGPRLSQRLRIRHQHDVVFVEENRPVLLLGRELGNDVVIMDPRASRQHARIERRRDGFTLIDSSTNGSWVIGDGGVEQHVRQDAMALSGTGRIGCGFPAHEIDSDLVFFDLG